MLLAINPELEQSARASGATWLQTMRYVVLPLLRPAIIAAWLMLFVIFIRELGATILLYAQGTETISVVLVILSERNFGYVAALAVMQLDPAARRLRAVPRASGASLRAELRSGSLSAAAMRQAPPSCSRARPRQAVRQFHRRRQRVVRGGGGPHAGAARPERLRQDDHPALHRRAGDARSTAPSRSAARWCSTRARAST